MNIWFKTAYVLGSLALLALIWNSIDAAGGDDDLLGRLMTLRFMGFAALMLLFYYIFFNFLAGEKKKRENGKR